MHIGHMRHSLVICGLLTFFEVAAQGCPQYKLGAVKVEGTGGTTYLSTAVMEFVGDKASAFDTALVAAKIIARDNLKRLTTLPQDSDGKISGIVDVAHCATDSKVFATVKYTAQTGTAAGSLRRAMENSLRENPTPQPK